MGILKPLLLMAQFAYAACCGWCVWAVLHLLAMPERSSGLGVYQTHFTGLSSIPMVSLIASFLSFVTVRAFTALEDGVCSAILYCYMWDRQDGVMDGNVPDSFKPLVDVSIKAHTKTE